MKTITLDSSTVSQLDALGYDRSQTILRLRESYQAKAPIDRIRTGNNPETPVEISDECFDELDWLLSKTTASNHDELVNLLLRNYRF